MIRTLLASATTFCLALGVSAAQSLSERIEFTPPSAPSLPFNVGETLVYDVGFSKFIFSGTVGELKLSVSQPSDSSDLIEFKAEAVSKGFFPALFGVKVRDRYTSLVTIGDFGLQTSTKLLEEGKVRREQKSVFDRKAGRVTFIDRDLANVKSEPKLKERPSPTWVQDLLSTIYFLRTQPLREGDVVAVPISDAGEVYNIEVIAGKRVDVKTNAGKFKTIQLNAKVFDGRYIKRSGEMLVWVTDDARRIPVRARIKVSGSTITVNLKRLP